LVAVLEPPHQGTHGTVVESCRAPRNAGHGESRHGRRKARGAHHAAGRSARVSSVAVPRIVSAVLRAVELRAVELRAVELRASVRRAVARFSGALSFATQETPSQDEIRAAIPRPEPEGHRSPCRTKPVPGCGRRPGNGSPTRPEPESRDGTTR